MQNLSLPLFRFDGCIRLKVEPTPSVNGMTRVFIHDAAEPHLGKDITVSMPAEYADNLSKAVAAFNREMGTAE